MANTPGFTVDLSQYDIPEDAGYVTQDENGRLDYWGDGRPVTKSSINAWYSELRVPEKVGIGHFNFDWQNAITEWPLRSRGDAHLLYDIGDRVEVRFDGEWRTARVVKHYGVYTWTRLDDTDQSPVIVPGDKIRPAAPNSKPFPQESSPMPGGMITPDPGGQKHDSDKPRLDLLFSGCPDALTEIAQVLTYGAVKYGEHNWKWVDNADKRYLAAAGRHELSYQRGHCRDPESGYHHLAHEACCVLFRLQRALECGE